MSEYIRLLQEMFSGKIYLDEVEVGTIFGVSPLTITDRKYRNTLPFSVCSFSSKFRVSIVELARFMEEDRATRQSSNSKFITIPMDGMRQKPIRKSRSKLYKGQEIG